jgi:hypothetical protein
MSSGVKILLSQLVSQVEHLSTKGHLRVDSNAETSLEVVVEQPRGSFGEIGAKGQAPDELVLV